MKGALLPKEVRNYVVNRPNETIYIGFSKLPTTYQKRAFVGFLYQAKKEILNLKEYKKKFIKENMIDEYWEDYLKKNMPIFEMDLSFLLEITNYGKNQKRELIELLSDMKNIKVTQIKVKAQIKVKDERLNAECKYDFDFVDLSDEEIEQIKEIVISNMVTYVKVDFNKKKVYFALSPEINQYLYYSKDYTKMNILIPSFINSTYAIELYEILLDKFQSNRDLMNKGLKNKKEVIETGWINLEVFYKKMAINENHTLRTFKYFKRELKKWIAKINNLDIVEFTIENFETKKTGRKITHLKFYLKERNLEIEKKIDFKTFRQNLIKQAQENNDDIFIYLGDEVYELKKGYLFKDGKILKNEVSLEIWEKLYKNKDKLIIKTFEELIKEQEEEYEKTKNLYEKIKELKDTYKSIKVKLKNGEQADCAVSDIVYEDDKIKIYLLCDNSSLTPVFENIEAVENFLSQSKKS